MTNETWKYGYPDWLRRIEKFTGVSRLYLPRYRLLEEYLDEQEHIEGDYMWVQDLNAKLLDFSEFKNGSTIYDEKVPFEYFYPRVIAHNRVFYVTRKFWSPETILTGYEKFFKRSEKLEYDEYRQYSKRHLGWITIGHQYNVLFDAKRNHPSSVWAWSAWREERSIPGYRRKSYYLRKWDSIWPIMGRMVDFAMTMGHILIITEPRVLGGLMMKRVLHGYNVFLSIIYLTTFGYLVASPRYRYPCIFIIPCLLTKYFAHSYKHDYLKDPVHHYDYWTSWTNDPGEVNCFRHVDVHRNLVLDEDITFMLRDDIGYRKVVNKCFSTFALYHGFFGIYDRLKLMHIVNDYAWEITKRNVCVKTGLQIYFAIESMHYKCYYQPFTNWGDRMVHCISLVLIHYFFLGCIYRKVRKVIHKKTRTRRLINFCTIRAMMGERRYMRLVEAMYWTYRTDYPRDNVGIRDRWYLSERHRNTPGTHQFYF